MGDTVNIPVPLEPEYDRDGLFGKPRVSYTVKTISRQKYDAGLVKKWFDKHKDADVQVYSQDTHMPLYAIYATPLAYHEEENQKFFSEIRRIAAEQRWEEE